MPTDKMQDNDIAEGIDALRGLIAKSRAAATDKWGAVSTVLAARNPNQTGIIEEQKSPTWASRIFIIC